ncbi:hypothetical protein [Corynebacterium sp. AOP34-BR1-29]|uniref:hypothetical protein n=1 Tax=Corynebacterium sp. AOP34-BR1-29 TaxID=3457688 RepID=UPI004034ACA3
MYVRSSGDGGLRPSELPRVLAHRRALTARHVVSEADLADSTCQLHRIDTMISHNEDRSQSPLSAVAWSLVVVVLAVLLVGGGLWLFAVPGGGTQVVAQVAARVLGGILVLGGAVSGTVSLVYLWSGVLLHRRARHQDRDFRDAVGALLPAASGAQSRSDLVDLLHDNDVAELSGRTRHDTPH